MTRGAISRHVKLLEEHLGVPLFRRLPQGLELTEQGRRFLPVLTQAFDSIRQGARRLASERSDLRVVCGPTLSIRWLIPKLEQFRARHPDIRVRLTTGYFEWDDHLNGAYDLGFGSEHYRPCPPEIVLLPLLPMLIVPACAPALLRERPGLRMPEDLANMTLLHENPDHHDWKCWLKRFGVRTVDPNAGETFPNLDMAVKAAVMGHGVVMADVLLTRDEIETGQLVLPFPDLRCDTDWGRFCLAGPRDRWHEPKVAAFRSWVEEIAAEDMKELSLTSG